jgi:hypothetical protein
MIFDMTVCNQFVVMASFFKIVVFCDLTPYSFVDGYNGSEKYAAPIIIDSPVE